MKATIYSILLSFFIWSVTGVSLASAVTKDDHYQEESEYDHKEHAHGEENQEHEEDSHEGHDHDKESEVEEHAGHGHGEENLEHDEDPHKGHNYKGHDDHEGHDEEDDHGNHNDHEDEHDGHDHDAHSKEKDSHKGHDDPKGHKGHDDHEGHDHGKKVRKEPKEEHDDHEGHGGHDDHGEEGVISLDEEARSMIQLKTEKISKRNLGGHLKVYGKVAKDTENYSYVSFDGEGKIESIKTNLGNVVNKGTELLTIRKDDGTRERVKSEIHGVVMSIFVKPGDRVDALTSLISVIDVDTLRATIDIYERDLRLVRVGQDVKLTTAAYPDKIFKGEVVYISPQVDEHTQAIKVRVDIDNPQHLLRLGMFVSGELIYASKKKVLAVPLTAVQRLEEDIVFVAEEGNNLRLREVVLGRSVNDYVEVKKGLNEGEVVVTQGSFYLKSEQAKEGFGDGHNH